jgi:DNA-binding NarL/FixJ family response regulator
MKIIVVDDHIAAEEAVHAALMSDPAEHNVVTGVRTLDELARIEGLQTFDLAFVDLDFRRESKKSGLLALRLLRDARVRAVIYAADEDNRVLFLLAAFQFYQPWALLSKSASGNEIREQVAAVKAGVRRYPPEVRRYLPPPHPCPPRLDELIHRASDLPIWRELATHSDRYAVARAANVSRSKVDSFLSDHSEVVAGIESDLLLRTRPVPQAQTTRGSQAKAYEHRFAPMHSFAAEHHRFFQDAEVEALIDERDRARATHVRPRRRDR